MSNSSWFTRRGVLRGALLAPAVFMSEQLILPTAHTAGAFSISTGKVDITPSPAEGAWLAGYATDNGPRAATGAAGRLLARCTVLRHGDRPYVLVTADVLAFPRSMNQAIRSAVYAHGVAEADIVLTATHTHNGPVLPERLDPYIAYAIKPKDLAPVQAYAQRLKDDIVQLVTDTLTGAATPCTLEYSVTREDFAVNRADLQTVERDVPVLAARDGKNNVLAVLFSYGCHPVTLGSGVDQFDPDYPGTAIARIEEAVPGSFAQFILGPAGDQNPDPGGGRGPALRTRAGDSLGRRVVKALATPGRRLTGPLTTSYRELQLPLDTPHTRQAIDAVRTAFLARKENARVEYERRHAELMLQQIPERSFATSVPLPVQVWSLGGAPDLSIILTGGELVSAYGAYFRTRYGGSERVWVCGYANEVPAYIPTDELLYRHPGGSYEGGWGTDSRKIGGGSIAAYGWMCPFRGKPTPEASDGVEQLLTGAVTAQLGPAPTRGTRPSPDPLRQKQAL